MADEDVERQLARSIGDLARHESERRPAVELIEERAQRRRRRRSMTRWGAIAAVCAAVLVGAGAIATTTHNRDGDSISVSEPSTSSGPATSSPATTIGTGRGSVRTLPWINTAGTPGTREQFRKTLDATGVDNVSACFLDELEVVASISGAGGADYALIQVHNRLSRTCFVQGSPSVAFLDRAGHTLGAYTPNVSPSDPKIVLLPGSWARVGLTEVGPDDCPNEHTSENSGSIVAAIDFGLIQSATRSVRPDGGGDPGGCPVQLVGTHTGPFESIPSAPANGLLYGPLRGGMTLNVPARVQRGATLDYSVTFTNHGLNGVALDSDNCPLYREWFGRAASGTLLLNCDGANGVLVAPGHSVRFAMQIEVPDNEPLGLTTLRWQFLEPRVPAMTATVVVVDGAVSGTPDGSLDVLAQRWDNIKVPGATCFQDHDIQLDHGRALLPDDKRGYATQPDGKRYLALYDSRPTFGDFDGDGHDDAAVPLDCTNNGGTADGQLQFSYALYSGRTGTLTYVGLITPQVTPPHEHVTLVSIASIGRGTITVDETFYGPNDATCCASGAATTTWTFSEGKLVPGTPVITKQPN